MLRNALGYSNLREVEYLNCLLTLDSQVILQLRLSNLPNNAIHDVMVEVYRLVDDQSRENR